MLHPNYNAAKTEKPEAKELQKNEKHIDAVTDDRPGSTQHSSF